MTFTGPGPGLQDHSRVATAEAAALWRAMPPTRMLDYGMDYSDVVALWERTGAGERWDVVAEELADARLERAEDAEFEGRSVTALDSYLAAIADLQFAQMSFNFDVDRKRHLYARLVDTAERASGVAEPAWQRLRLPFGGGWLRGWRTLPAARPVLGTVIVFGGQSGWGLAYLRAAESLARRGIAAILAEGPGQGESRLDGGILLDLDFPSACSAFVDHVLADDELGGAVGLWGNGLGGLFAAATAVRDGRVVACCVNGAPAIPRLLSFRTFAEQAAAMVGTTDMKQVVATFEGIRFDPRHDQIGCPLLVLHGGRDPIVDLDDQRPFLHAARYSASALRVWEDGDHGISNHAADRNAEVGDWFLDRFVEHRALHPGVRSDHPPA